MPIKSRLLFFLIVILLLSISKNGVGVENSNEAENELLVLTEEWTPFNFPRNGKIVGISTDLVTATLNHANLDFKLKILPWKRAYKTTLKRKNTLLFTTNRLKPRENLFYWIGPLYKQDVTFYRLASKSHIKINQMEDLRNYKAAVTRGGSSETYLKTNGFIEGTHYFSYSDETQAERMLLSDHVDLITMSDLILRYRQQRNDRASVDFEPAFTIYQSSYYIAVNKDTSTELINKIETSFHQVVSDELREQTINKYFSNDNQVTSNRVK